MNIVQKIYLTLDLEKKQDKVFTLRQKNQIDFQQSGKDLFFPDI